MVTRRTTDCIQVEMQRDYHYLLMYKLGIPLSTKRREGTQTAAIAYSKHLSHGIKTDPNAKVQSLSKL